MHAGHFYARYPASSGGILAQEAAPCARGVGTGTLRARSLTAMGSGWSRSRCDGTAQARGGRSKFTILRHCVQERFAPVAAEHAMATDARSSRLRSALGRSNTTAQKRLATGKQAACAALARSEHDVARHGSNVGASLLKRRQSYPTPEAPALSFLCRYRYAYPTCCRQPGDLSAALPPCPQ